MGPVAAARASTTGAPITGMSMADIDREMGQLTARLDALDVTLAAYDDSSAAQQVALAEQPAISSAIGERAGVVGRIVELLTAKSAREAAPGFSPIAFLLGHQELSRVLGQISGIDSAGSDLPVIRGRLNRLELGEQAVANEKEFGAELAAIGRALEEAAPRIAPTLQGGSVGVHNESTIAALGQRLAAIGTGFQGPALRGSTTGAAMPTMDIAGSGWLTTDVSMLDTALKDVNNWDGWVVRSETYGRDLLRTVNPRLFNEEPAIIAIAVENEEQARQVLETYFGSVTAVKSAGHNLITLHDLGKITIHIFVNNRQGKEGLREELRTSGIPQGRIVTFAYAQGVKSDGTPQTDDIDDDLAKLSYKVVYMTGRAEKKEQAIATPIAACLETGLAILNYSDLETRPGITAEERIEAVTQILRGIEAMSGGAVDREKIAELAKKIQEQGLASVPILVSIRPINTNELMDFHRAEAQILRSL